MMTDASAFIPLSDPALRGNELAYLKECVDTNWVSSAGPFVERFEQEIAAYCSVKHAVATVNGTAALHIALIVAGVKADEEVIVSDLTFIAPANTVRYVGAHTVFMDVEPDFWQMDPQKLKDFLEKECRWSGGALWNRMSGRRIRAVIPVHILGHPVDMDPLIELAEKYGLVLIEDASEALGAKYKGRAPGSIGKIGCLSFNGNKIITTGGGGMILTDDESLANTARHLTTQAKSDPIEYTHDEIGFNYRMPNVLAALGCAQLESLDAYVKTKLQIAERYSGALSRVMGVRVPAEAEWAGSTFWLYTVELDEHSYGMEARSLMKRLAALNIQTRPLWQPMHMSPAHRGAQAYRCEVSERLWRRALSLPSSVGLADMPGAQNRVIGAIAAEARA